MKIIISDRNIDKSKANLELRIIRNIKEKKGEENDTNEEIKTNKKRSVLHVVYKTR